MIDGTAYPGLEVVAECRDRLGESPLWDSDTASLVWVDFFGPTIRQWKKGDSAATSHHIGSGSTIGSLALCTGQRLMLSLEAGLTLFDPASGRLQAFADPNGGRESVGYNDAKVDRQGRLWVGTYDVAEKEPRGILYSVSGSGLPAIGDSGFIVCNGPAFSPDGKTLYFSDSIGRRILAYTMDDATGRLRDRRLFAGLESSIPDGLCTDSAGNLWCAHYGGGQLSRFRPDGSLDRVVTLPVRNVTSCCLGGEDFKTLFVTTGEDTTNTGAATGLDGAVFAIEVDIPGLPEPLFDPRVIA